MSLRLLRRVALPLLLCLGSPLLGGAQENPAESPRTAFWGFAALGIGATDADSTFDAAGIGAAVQVRRLVFLGRIASVGPEKENRMEDFGLLLGFAPDRRGSMSRPLQGWASLTTPGIVLPWRFLSRPS